MNTSIKYIPVRLNPFQLFKTKINKSAKRHCGRHTLIKKFSRDPPKEHPH